MSQGITLTQAQIDALAQTVELAHQVAQTSEEYHYSDTLELWHIINMFEGVAASILKT